MKTTVVPLVPLDKIDDVWFHTLNDLNDTDTQHEMINSSRLSQHSILKVINTFATIATRMNPVLQTTKKDVTREQEESEPCTYQHLYMIWTFQEIQAARTITSIQQ
ncbi:hypothetical protein CHS0354_016847 [Potamilus streckersoni]|uniref:Uncharacterized protein n=1 Tax=Potamilus streckersoni TaxID=2493646 RepID=A0AAE0SVK7_9BIVA|nr:hypothetical protein CHS0354_016847 [Potamilus streckersoni]